MTITAPAGPADTAAVEKAALIRRARQRLDRIEDMRAAHRLQQAGKTQRQIAEILHTTQPRIHRMLKAAESADSERQTPEEVILHAAVDGTGRDTLVAALSDIAYTFTEYAPAGLDGSVPGTWNQVLVALGNGMITEEEYDRVAAAVKPTAA